MFENAYTRLQTYYRAPLAKYRKYEYYVLQNVMAGLASTLASVYLEEKVVGGKYNHEGINKVRKWYTQSLESDIIGNNMKYASFFFCNGEYDEACKYCDLIEKLIQGDNDSHLVYLLFVSPPES